MMSSVWPARNIPWSDGARRCRLTLVTRRFHYPRRKGCCCHCHCHPIPSLSSRSPPPSEPGARLASPPALQTHRVRAPSHTADLHHHPSLHNHRSSRTTCRNAATEFRASMPATSPVTRSNCRRRTQTATTTSTPPSAAPHHHRPGTTAVDSDTTRACQLGTSWRECGAA